MFTDCRVTESTDGISLIKRISIWESIKKTWLIVDPISVENQIQLEHVSPSLWDLLDRQSFCRWMKVQLSTRLGGWERAIRSELARILTIQSWSRVIINSGRISVIISGFAETSRVALGCIHVCVPFWCDPSGSRGEHNMGSSRFVRIPTSAAQCSFQTLLCCGCCGGGGDNGDDDDDNGFFCNKTKTLTNLII